MELKQLISLVWRWAWLLVLGTIMGVAGGFLASQIQTPVYEATAKALVSRTRQQSSTDMLSMSDQQLALTYLQLVTTQPVINEASSRLGVSIDAKENVQAELIANTQIFRVTVLDKDPVMAANIANTLVQIIVEQNDALQAGRYKAYEDALNTQVEKVQIQIDNLQSQINQISEASIQEQLTQVNQAIEQLQVEISALEKEVAVFPVFPTADQKSSMAEKQAVLDQNRYLLGLYQQIQANLTYIGKPKEGNSSREDPRLTSLQSTLNLYQQIYLNLLNNLETVRLARLQNTPNVAQIDPAVPPSKPIRPTPVLYIALAGMVGLLISGGGILLIDYFDETLKSSGQVEASLGSPVIGLVIKAKQLKKELVVSRNLDSLDAENFRNLYVNVELANGEKQFHTLMVTSAGLAEGKTTIAINLAALYVQSGKRVILVDANLRRPHVHTFLKIKNTQGFSDLLSEDEQILPVDAELGGGKKLSVIPVGSILANQAGLVQIGKMARVMQELNKRADVIIFDAPAFFIAEARVLAAKVDAVLFVVDTGQTKIEAAVDTMNQLKRINPRVLGVVMNRVPRSQLHFHKNIETMR